MKNYCLVLTFFIITLTGKSQQVLTLDQAIQNALMNNGSLRSAEYQTESQRALRKTDFDLPKTSVSLLTGQYNSFTRQDNALTITQTIPFTVFGSQGNLNSSLVTSSELRKSATENQLIFDVKQVYFRLAFLEARRNLLMQQDSIYNGFYRAASLRYKTGETNLLERTTAETQLNEVRNKIARNEADARATRTQLQVLLNTDFLPGTNPSEWHELPFSLIPDSTALLSNPSISFMKQQTEVAGNLKKLEIARTAPDIVLGFFSQTLIDNVDLKTGRIATNSDRFTGFQVGVALPLWFVPYQGRIQAAEYGRLAAQSDYEYYRITVLGQYHQALQQYRKNRSSLDYYNTSALPNADLILKQSETAYRNGEIDYAAYLISLQSAITIKEGYLQTLSDYNQSIIYIESLSGIK